MLRRSFLQFSSRRSVAKIPIPITSQIPSYLSSRKAFSTTSQQPEGSDGKQSDSGKKILGGALLLGSVAFAAYHYGLAGLDVGIDQRSTSKPVDFGTTDNNIKQPSKSSQSSLDSKPLGEAFSKPPVQESDTSTSILENSENIVRDDSDITKQDDENKKKCEVYIQVDDTPVGAQDDKKNVQEKDVMSSSEVSVSSKDASTSPSVDDEMSGTKIPDTNPDMGHRGTIQSLPTIVQDNSVPTAHETNMLETQDVPKGDMTGQTSSLLDDYYLRDADQAPTSSNKGLDLAIKDMNDAYISKDGKLVLDFLEAIHEAEKRQAELDARTFREEKRMLKEKYEKELKDARARELMYAEREALLDKELNREKAKAAAALKSLQEKLEEKHKLELEEKETAAELRLKRLQELAKAEMNAAIASEKASQIEKVAEANVHINALCMAFYARSEEARQSHSAHKLALGALSLEDALSKGLPIQKEIEALHTYLEGIDKDSLLDLVLSSLPEETQSHGTDTLLQLNHKFDALKQTLRHFSLIPPGGGGILAHSLAHVASRLKVKEADQSGDGIESLINRVESLLAQGKLSEAARALEDGVKGSQASGIVDDWVRRARNRAITEQALKLLQSFATSISLT